jgi:hypothetical protein
MQPMSGPLSFLLGLALLAAAWILLPLAQLPVRRLLFRWRLTRLEKALTKTASVNEAKMLVARAHLPWPWITIALDGFAQGVTVPEHKRSAWMSLQFGDNMPTPIQGLMCNENGIGGTLSFDGKPAHTWVPWDAVYAMGSSGPTARWSWIQHMDPAWRSRVSMEVYGRSLRCPGCNWPPFGVTWVCDGCGEPMDPFLTSTLCPNCGDTNAAGVQCAECRERFQKKDWQREEIYEREIILNTPTGGGI